MEYDVIQKYFCNLIINRTEYVPREKKVTDYYAVEY